MRGVTGWARSKLLFDDSVNNHNIMTEPTGIEAEPQRVGNEAPSSAQEVARWRFFRGFRRIWHGMHFVGVLAAGITIFVALVRAKAPPEFLDLTLPPMPVAAITAEEGDHPSTITAYGEVVARRSADIRAIVGGPILRVSEHFANGAPVVAGEVLLELDPFEYERRVEETGAAVREAEARLMENRETNRHQMDLVALAEERRNLTRTEYERQVDLAEQNVSARRTLEAAQSQLAAAEADLTQRRQQATTSTARIAQQEAILERLRATEARSRRALSDTQIRAAFDGYLAQVSGDLGQQIKAGERIARLIDTAVLEVRFFIPEGQLARLVEIADKGIGAICVVSWRTDAGIRTYSARVTRIEGEIQTNRAGVNVYARISDADLESDPIRPGAFVQVELFEETHVRTFQVPSEAVRPGPSLLVATEGIAVVRSVAVVARAGRRVLVRGDLAPGEAVILTRSGELHPGDAIAVVGNGSLGGQ